MLDEIAAAHKRARSRLLLLDYDGTLMEIRPTPAQAKPTPDILNLVTKLAADPRNKVVIISGREHGNLEEWLGHAPIDIAAEHGLFIKESGQPWRQVERPDTSWKNVVRAVMEGYVQQAPGSFIEEKTATLGWHWRIADEKPARALAPKLIAQLQKPAADFALDILEGDKVVEAKPASFNKGTVAGYWLNRNTWDFILAVGDDATDEDLFKAMPARAHTIKVGTGTSGAKLRLASPRALRALLASLA